MTQTKRTYRATILQILQNPRTQITCGEICKRLIKRLDIATWKHQYISASISSILHKLVDEGLVEYSTTKKGPKGGYVYQKQARGWFSFDDIRKSAEIARDKRFKGLKK
jgi:predicted transcriptional regulator